MEKDSLKLRAKDVGVIVAMIVWLATMLVAQASARGDGWLHLATAVAADQSEQGKP
jgi:hypothetical protein